MSEPPANSPSKNPECVHSWTIVQRIAHAEIDEADPVAHTGVIAVGCCRCHLVLLYPIENAALITRRYVDALRRDLAARNWSLPVWPDGDTHH
jgi:hypothetical protein